MRSGAQFDAMRGTIVMQLHELAGSSVSLSHLLREEQ